MSKIKTMIFGIVSAPLTASFVVAAPLYETFAICTGRFSAELEHAWLMGSESSEVESHHSVFITLLEAATPDELQTNALSLRIDAKAAHSQILSQAVFAADVPKMRWAAQRAKIGRDSCTNLLLDS